jgi:hypothetical protein
MTRFQLVFRDGSGDRIEHWDNSHGGVPHIEGRLIVDGETYVIRGADWIIRRDGGEDDFPRFLCTLVSEPAGA